MLTDKLTNEKVHVCEECSRIANTCFVCGLPVKKDSVKLPDGRFLCARDAKTAVLDNAEAKRICRQVEDDLDRLFSRFTDFPTNLDVSIVDRVNLLALFKIPGNDYTCPDVLGYFQAKTNHHQLRYEIHVMSALTEAEMKATCAHEYTHAWIHRNVPEQRREALSQDAEEGFCELVSYLLMDSQHQEKQKELILKNEYTRGQIQIMLDAESKYGFNDVVDWMKYGKSDELEAYNPGAVRDVQLPQSRSAPVNNLAYIPKPSPEPDHLVLKGISWNKARPLALINNQSFGAGESAKVRVGSSNIVVRCLSIRPNSVRVKLAATGEELELLLAQAPQSGANKTAYR